MLLSKLYTLRGMLKDGNAKFSTKYFGAGTGRWSGDGKFNMQNLPREELFGVNLRKLLIPDEGCKLLSVDLAQIEARVLLWAVQDEGMLRLIRSGHNLYEAHAESSMGWKDTGLKKKNPRLYALAKARVLGAGYGAGPTTFKRIAKMLAGLDLTNEECVNTIQSFRASNPKVVQFWYTLSRKILEKTYARNGACSIRLPSGRSLVYHELGLEGKDPMGTLVRGTPRKKLFGGLLTENYVQAVARDLLADYWVRMVEAGLDIRFTVHDEFVINSSNENRDLQIAQEIVHNPPLWLEGCPIGCEAVFSDYYVK
jgi:DNA polymerase